MDNKLKLLNLKIWFALLFFIVAICGVASAFASTATWKVFNPASGSNTTYTFNFAGSSCASFATAWAASYTSIYGGVGLTASNCSGDRLELGYVTYNYSYSNGVTGYATASITVLDAGSGANFQTAITPTAESQAIDRLNTVMNSSDSFTGQLAGLAPNDALSIIASVLALWAAAWGVRQVAQFLNLNERSHHEES